MNKIHKRRIYYFSILALLVSIAVGLILYALKNNLNVFLTPKQIAARHLPPDYHFRLGGMVKTNSVQRKANGLEVQFIVTDFKTDVMVQYNGILPDLFREGSGVIVEGSLNNNGTFIATAVLAKHDENYMPKNVYQALREDVARDQNRR